MRDGQSFWKFLWARLGSGSRHDQENDPGGNHQNWTNLLTFGKYTSKNQNWTLWCPQIIAAHKSESRRKYEKVFLLYYWMNKRDCKEWQTFFQTLAQVPLKSLAEIILCFWWCWDCYVFTKSLVDPVSKRCDFKKIHSVDVVCVLMLFVLLQDEKIIRDR